MIQTIPIVPKLGFTATLLFYFCPLSLSFCSFFSQSVSSTWEVGRSVWVGFCRAWILRLCCKDLSLDTHPSSHFFLVSFFRDFLSKYGLRRKSSMIFLAGCKPFQSHFNLNDRVKCGGVISGGFCDRCFHRCVHVVWPGHSYASAFFLDPHSIYGKQLKLRMPSLVPIRWRFS